MATIAIGISKSPGGAANATIPINSLAEDGVPPEEGDKVSFSVDGTVKSVSGSNATVSIDSVNGEPVGEEAAESPEEEASEGEEETSGSSNPGPPNPGPNPGLGAPPAAASPAPLAARLPRAGTAKMRANLLRGARGRALPF